MAEYIPSRGTSDAGATVTVTNRLQVGKKGGWKSTGWHPDRWAVWLLVSILAPLAGSLAAVSFYHYYAPPTPASEQQNVPQTPVAPAPAPSPAPTPAPPPTPSPTPSTTPPTSAIPADGLYTVVPGDTFSGIAARFGISLAKLVALNTHISDPNAIFPGQIIRLTETNAPQTPPSPSPVPNPVPVISHIQTSQPVVFLTIDDGITKDPLAGTLMATSHVRASMFLVYTFIKDDPGYFGNVSAMTGSLIENHTFDHTTLTTLPYNQQVEEICSGADRIASLYGRRPILFRPPGGHYNSDTRQAAAACGMKALIMWRETINNGALQYQTGDHLQPGDIVLMHFRNTFAVDLQAFVTAANSQGLHTEMLEDWIH